MKKRNKIFISVSLCGPIPFVVTKINYITYKVKEGLKWKMIL